MRRRFFLSSAAALGATAVAPAFGQQKPVFLHYTQEQLDQAYDQAVWEPQLNELQAYDSASSAAVRKVLPPRTERYGKSDIELIDIFTPANASGAPIMVGAWLYNSRLDASFPAPTLVGRGAAYLTPDFNNVKQARLPDMIEQCRSAVEWAVRNAASFGGDPNRVYISGHSSGSHLASCVLITDWTKRGLPADTIKGALLMSGMYELYPAMLSSRGKYVQITPQEIDAASAMRHLRMVTCPVVVANGDRESPEFRRQSMVLADALQGMGRLAARTELFATNHFQVPQRLSKPDSELSQTLYALMKI
jgi:arylformamidase